MDTTRQPKSIESIKEYFARRIMEAENLEITSHSKHVDGEVFTIRILHAPPIANVRTFTNDDRQGGPI